MKAFWDNLFYDLDEGHINNETFASMAGKEVRDDLRRIEDAIEAHEGRKALTLIDELMRQY